MTITNAQNVTADENVACAGLLQSAGSGTTPTTTFSKTTTIGASGSTDGLRLTTTNVTFPALSELITTNSANITISQTGTLIMEGTVAFDGSLTQSTSAPVHLSGTMTGSANAHAVSFAGAVTLTESLRIDTALVNENITFSNTVDGTYPLTLAAGGGNIVFATDVGSTNRIGALKIESAHDVTMTNPVPSTIKAASIYVGSTAPVSGTIFSNNLNTNGKIGATNDGIYMIGRDIRRQGSITTTNGGSVHLTNSGAITGAVGNTTTISGDYIQDGTGPVSRSGIITAGGTISYLSSITMNHDIGWVAGGSLTLGPLSTLDGAAGSYSVDMSVGGEISLGAAFGSGTRLNVVTVSECTNWTSESIRAVSIVQTDASLTSVKTTFNGDLDTNGSGGINLTGAAFENNANWTAANGSILINNRGVFTSTAGTIQTTGSFNQSGVGSVSIGNTIIKASGVNSLETFAIAISGSLDITGGVALNNQNGSKDIVFHDTVDSTASQNMSITANTGDVLFEGLVGDSHPLGRITINSAEGVSFIGAKAGILDQVSGTGTTTLTGATETSSKDGITHNGISIVNKTIDCHGTLTTATGSGGGILLSASTALDLSAACSSDGTFSVDDAAGTVTFSGTVTSVGSISFAGPIDLSGAPYLHAGTGSITLSGAVNGPGAFELSGGSILWSQNAGATRMGAVSVTGTGISTHGLRAASLIMSNPSGTTTIVGDLDTNGVGGIDLSGKIFSIQGGMITTTGAPCTISHTGNLNWAAGSSSSIAGLFTENGTSGTVALSGTVTTVGTDILFANPITLQADANLRTGTGTGNITLSSDVAIGTYFFRLNADGGNITCDGTVTGYEFILENANDIDLRTVDVTCIDQLNGSGMTTFHSTVDTLDDCGLELTGTDFTFMDAVHAQGNGNATIVNGGVLEIQFGSPFTLGGSFDQSGGGSVNLDDSIAVGSGQIHFSDPVVLSHDGVVLSNNLSGNVNIAFDDTLSGAHSLELNAGAGTITFTGAVGTLSSLDASAATIIQSSTAHTSGNLVYTAASSIQLSGDITTDGGAMTLDGPLTVTQDLAFASNDGTIWFKNSLDGAFVLTFDAGTGDLILGGAVGGTAPPKNLVFNGAQLIQLGNNVTVSGDNPLNFADPVSVIGISTVTSNGEDIAFASTLIGPEAMTLNAGAGNIDFLGAVGATPLASLTATGTTITQHSTAATVGALLYTGSLNLWGNITTQAGAITMDGPVAAKASWTFDTTDSGGSPGGGTIWFKHALDGAYALSFGAGENGRVVFDGVVGGSAPPTNLAFNSAHQIRLSANVTVSGDNPLEFITRVLLTGPSTIRSVLGGNVIFDGTLDGANQTLDFDVGAGTVTFTGPVGSLHPLDSLTFTNAGLIEVGNTITMSGAAALDFTAPVDLTGSSTITSTDKNITFESTLGGTHALTLNAGAGAVDFKGVVGAVPLASLTVTAATITQEAAAATVGAFLYTGSADLGGNITTQGGTITFDGPTVAAVDLIFDATQSVPAGADIWFKQSLDGAQSLTFKTGTDGDLIFDGVVGGSSPPLNLIFDSGRKIQLGNSVTVSGANPLNFSKPVLLTGSDTITSNNQDIVFGSTLDGSQSVEFVAGSGMVQFTAPVGSIQPINKLTFTSAGLIDVGNNITMSGSNDLDFSEPVQISGNSIIQSNNKNITFNGTLDDSAIGSHTLDIQAGSGFVDFQDIVGATPFALLTVAAGTITQESTVDTVGALSYSGSLIDLQGNITTRGGTITFFGPVTANAALVLDTTGASSAGDTIWFTDTLNGANDLTFKAGAGRVIFDGVVGDVAPPTNLVFNSVHQIRLNADVTVSGANPLEFTTRVLLTGPSTITSILGNNVIFDNTLDGTQLALDFDIGAGTVTFTGSVGSLHPLDALTFTMAGSIEVGNNITMTGATALDFTAPVSLIGASVITSGDKNITFESALDGNYALTLNAGAGTVDFKGVLGATPLASLAVTAATIRQEAAAATVGSFLYTGSVDLGGNITTQGGTITLNGPTVASAGLIFDSTQSVPAGADIWFKQSLNGAQLFTFRAGTGGDVIFDAIVGGSAPPLDLTFDSARMIQLGANVTVSGANPLNFSKPVFLKSSNVITSNGADIGFDSTLNGAQTVDLAAGLGKITFTGIVGGSEPLNQINFISANLIEVGNNITMSGAAPLDFPSSVHIIGNSIIDSVSQNIIFESALDDGASGLHSLALHAGSGTVDFQGIVGTTPLASLAVEAGTVIQRLAVDTVGALSYLCSSIDLRGNITTQGGTIDMNGPVIATGDCTWTSAGADITYFGTLNGSGTLAIDAGAGNIIFDGPVGNITAPAGISMAAAEIQVGANISVSGGILFSDPVLITANSVITSISAGITFEGALNDNLVGSHTLAISADSGIIDFQDDIGVTPFASLTVAADTITQKFTAQAVDDFVYTASSIDLHGDIITQGGLITMNGPVITTGGITFNSAGGIALTGADITFNGLLNGAGILVFDAGTSGKVIFNGAVGGISPLTDLQVSASAVEIGADITVVNNLEFFDVVLIKGDSTITSNGANIIFDSQLRDIEAGAHQLTLDAGLGNVDFKETVGGTPLASLTVDADTITQEQSVETIGNIHYTAPTLIDIRGDIDTHGGTITMTGPVALSGDVSFDTTVSGLLLPGADIRFTSTLTGSGTITLDAGVTGAITQESTASAAGALTYTAGSITVKGNITTGGGMIIMDGPTTAVGDIAFDSTNLTPAGATIDFMNSLSGSGILTFHAGTDGFVIFGGAVSEPANLLFSAVEIQIGGSITTSGANPLVFNAPVLLNGSGTITSNGNDITFDSTLNGSRSLTLDAGAGIITFTGAVGGSQPLTNLTFTGAGSVHINNNVTMSGANPLIFSAPVLLTGNSVITSNNAAVQWLGTIDGGWSLNIAAGYGGVSGSGAVGSGTALNVFDIQSTGAVALPEAHASQINVNAGSLLFGGALFVGTGSFESLHAIMNAGAPVEITSSGDLTFNALGGDVGAMASGIQVASAGPVYVGSTDLGNFNGTALGNTIHVLAANLPIIVYFNGVVVYQRNPPNPSPVPPLPSFVEPPYQAVGFDSSSFNLGSYFYFLPDFLDESSLERRPLIFLKG